MSHRTFVVWDCVLQRNVIWRNVVRRIVVEPTVGVNSSLCTFHWYLKNALILVNVRKNSTKMNTF